MRFVQSLVFDRIEHGSKLDVAGQNTLLAPQSQTAAANILAATLASWHGSILAKCVHYLNAQARLSLPIDASIARFHRRY